MKNLVLKDIKLLGVFNLFLLMTSLSLAAISVLPKTDYYAMGLYFFAILVPIYVLIIRMSVNDMTSNVNPLLISLPVKKFQIVKSRYISILMYIFIISLTVFLSSNISRLLLTSNNGSIFTISGMFFAISIILLFLSINIPLQYYDPRKTQIFNALLYGFIILTPNLLSRFDIDLLNNAIVQRLLSLDLRLIAPIVLIISLLIYLGSLFISNAIYGRKEF